MKRRIFAWVLLAGFVLLVLNLIVFRVYWQLSMVIYLIIMFAFLFTNGKFNTVSQQDEPRFDDGEGYEDGEAEDGSGSAQEGTGEVEEDADGSTGSDGNEGNGRERR